MKRDFKVGIVSEEEYNREVCEILKNADKGFFLINLLSVSSAI